MIALSTVRAHFSENKELFHAIKNIFGFYPGNIFLYKLALTHKSVAEEIKEGVKDSNERLEYLGDAILGAIIAEFLFKKFPFKDEGFLTETRSKIVSRAQLNQLSMKLGLNKLLNAQANGSGKAHSVNGDALEAFIGAIYLDKGYATCRKIIMENIINVHLDLDNILENNINYKSKLIEWAQKNHYRVDFVLVEELGHGNDKQYVSKVFIENQPYEEACDFSIKGAEKLAAEKTFKAIHKKMEKYHS